MRSERWVQRAPIQVSLLLDGRLGRRRLRLRVAHPLQLDCTRDPGSKFPPLGIGKPEPLHHPETVLYCVSPEVVGKVPVDLLRVPLDFLNLWNPILDLRVAVPIVVPLLLTPPVPSDYGKVRRDHGVRLEQRIVGYRVRYLALP